MIKDKIKELIGRSLYAFNTKIDKKINENDYRNKQQDHKINALIGNIDDNFITKEEPSNIVSLENSIDGALTVEEIQGNTKYVKKDGTIVNTFEDGVSLKSVGEDGKISILSCGKNLFDYNRFINSKNTQYYRINGENIEIIKLDDRSNKDAFITELKLKPNTDYILSCMGIPTDNLRVKLLDSDTMISTSKFNSGLNRRCGIKFIAYDRFPVKINDIQIEESSTQTSHDPYKEDKKEILIKEPLRGLPSGVRDSIENLKLTRRIGTRPYQQGDESNSKVLTDKVTTLYQLETPIIEDIDIQQATLLLKCFEKGTLFIDDDIPVGNIKVKYDADIPVKTNTLANSRYAEFIGKDINDSVFPTLMDLNYRCICIQLAIGKDISNRLLLLSDSYKILKRDILSKRLSQDEYLYRLHDYLEVKRISQEQYEELKGMIK